VKGAADMHH